MVKKALAGIVKHARVVLCVFTLFGIYVKCSSFVISSWGCPNYVQQKRRRCCWITTIHPNVGIRMVLDDKRDTSAITTTTASSSSRHKVLVLGGSGFVGNEIVRQLKARHIPYISTSTSGTVDNTIKLNLTAPNAQEEVTRIAKGCTAVISTVGSIGSRDDISINAASGTAAMGAKDAGVTNFVFVGNAQRVRDLSKRLAFLQDYARGKEQSERVIANLFGYHGCIIRPVFIYGGSEYGISPPRIASPLGKIAEEILGLYPIQAMSKMLPDLLGVPLEVPVSVESVAGAAVNVALGVCQGYTSLDTKDSIVMAASERDRSIIEDDGKDRDEKEKLRQEIKKKLLGTTQTDDGHDGYALMEELETLNERKPAFDSGLNGRWNFVFSNPDMGTALITELMGDASPLKHIYDLKDVYMEITDDQSLVKIVLSSKVLGQPVDIVLTTTLLPMLYDELTEGKLFVEQFDGVTIGGVQLPIPQDWQRSRYLEITYLDDEVLIARGAGKEPHILVR